MPVRLVPPLQGSGRGVPVDPVRALQYALYRAAKADPGRRFHALYDKIRRRDVLWRAWAAVRRNNGAPGIDKITLAAVEEYGVTRLLDELASELEEHRYRPLPARRVYIPKPARLRASRGRCRFPSHDYGLNKAWPDAAMIACILLSWLKFLALDGDLARAEPKTLRYRVLHSGARLVRGGRRRTLKIAATWL